MQTPYTQKALTNFVKPATFLKVPALPAAPPCSSDSIEMDPLLSPSHKRLLSNPTLATVTMRERSVKLLAEDNMPKRCAYGTCKSDTRYPQSLEGGVVFFAFPKPKTQEERCRVWIKQCGRPHDQLNPSKINKNTYVCSKVRC